jgi:hypothetical protein
MACQFDLVYHGHFSWGDTEKMPCSERNWHYNRLVELFEKQQQEQERLKKEMDSIKHSRTR